MKFFIPISIFILGLKPRLTLAGLISANDSFISPGCIGKKLIIYSGHSIQDGIEAAEDGDTVFVQSGEYFETLMIDKSNITIMGDRKNGDLPVLNGKNILPDAGVGTGSNIEINGFIIKNYTANGLMLNRSRDVTSVAG